MKLMAVYGVGALLLLLLLFVSRPRKAVPVEAGYREEDLAHTLQWMQDKADNSPGHRYAFTSGQIAHLRRKVAEEMHHPCP